MTSWLERYLELLGQVMLRMTMVLLVVVSFVQVIMTKETSRQFLSYVDRLEGSRLVDDQNLTAPGYFAAQERNLFASFTQMIHHNETTIILRCVHFEGRETVGVWQNGKLAALFQNEETRLKVCEGDLLELDGTKSQHKLLFVVEANPRLITPAGGSIFETDGTMILLGRVKFRR